MDSNGEKDVKIGNGGLLFDLNRYEKAYFEGSIGKKFILKNINIFVSISKEIQKTLIKSIDEDKIISIPNGIETYCDSSKKTFDNIQHKIRIISVGSLTQKKNYDFIIKTLSTLNDDLRQKLQFFILGDGPEKNLLEKQTKNMGMNSVISFIGNVDNVMDYMLSSDLFILASQAEGMSNALLEAISCGLPCICSDVGSNRQLIVGNSINTSIKKNEFLKGACGYIFTSNSKLGFLNALKSFLDLDNNQKKKLSSNAVNISSYYDIKRVAEKYEKLYNKLLFNI